MGAKKLFDGKSPRLCIDQYGTCVWARSLRELRTKAHSKSSPQKQYSDLKEGGAVWTGYVIGRQWFTVYAPVEIPA